ncbi:MAG: 4Fe-4S dicluster domain-containing protein [Promethearchaeota archaeon]|nr:MAG: 4Fe-4S dicluster domain-containing protein [Candidatus Lokiarchaeota archaeon]
MTRPIWFVLLLKKAFPSIKILAKLTNLPLIGKIFDLLLFKEDDIIYLPKDNVIEVNQSLETPENYAIPSKILEYFIEKANYHWIMDFCICRASMKCEDYPINHGCLFLGKGVLDINPKLGKLVSKKEALEHLQKGKEAGLVNMIGRNLLDKQWLGVRDGGKLLSICFCCPCCCLWQVAPILDHKIGSKVKKIPGVKLIVNDNCIGCGKCIENVCFVNAIYIKDKKAHITEECRGCGRCVEICPNDAIDLIVENKDYINKAIKNLDRLINVKD